MYMTPVMSTALIWRFIIPKVPSRAADARRITQTMAQEIDKLCISERICYIESKRVRKPSASVIHLHRRELVLGFELVYIHNLDLYARQASLQGFRQPRNYESFGRYFNVVVVVATWVKFQNILLVVWFTYWIERDDLGSWTSREMRHFQRRKLLKLR